MGLKNLVYLFSRENLAGKPEGYAWKTHWRGLECLNEGVSNQAPVITELAKCPASFVTTS